MRNKQQLDIYIERFKNKDKYALAKIITFVENNPELAWKIIEELPKVNKFIPVIGITGSPGVGKSTFVSKLVRLWSDQGLEIGILAVDPSSPFSGGAFLGDRIRMREIFRNERVYIRSISSRGSVGGLSDSIYDIVDVMKRFGFDRLIIETVGAGQSEIEIMYAADFVILILSPDVGDEIQLMKSGIMEISDIYVINKGDLPESGKIAMHLKNLFQLDKDSKKDVIKVSSLTGEGFDLLNEKIEKFIIELKETDLLKERELRRNKRRIRNDLLRSIDEILNDISGNLDEIKSELIKRLCEKYEEV